MGTLPVNIYATWQKRIVSCSYMNETIVNAPFWWVVIIRNKSIVFVWPNSSHCCCARDNLAPVYDQARTQYEMCTIKSAGKWGGRWVGGGGWRMGNWQGYAYGKKIQHSILVVAGRIIYCWFLHRVMSYRGYDWVILKNRMDMFLKASGYSFSDSWFAHLETAQSLYHFSKFLQEQAPKHSLTLSLMLTLGDSYHGEQN